LEFDYNEFFNLRYFLIFINNFTIFGEIMKINLNGNWYYVVDVNNQGLKNNWFTWDNYKENPNLGRVILPNCWNNIEENGERVYDKYEGTMWFYKEFNLEDIIKNHDYYLQFNGSNYLSMVWLNGKYLGRNEGGFLPFKFRINNYIIKGSNFVAIRVDNIRRTAGIPGKATDWYNWGGIYRDIYIDILPINRLNNIKIKTLSLSSGIAEVQFSYEMNNPFDFSWEISYQNKKIKGGKINRKNTVDYLKIEITNPYLWSPQDPNLYLLKIINNSGKIVHSIRFGIRLIEIKKGFLYINKKLAKLRGVSLHEELLPYGRAVPREERKKDILRMKEFGFNALRTSHYSHDESLIELADELGIYILEEIPIYWNIKFKNPRVLKLGAHMIKTLVNRDYNHSSVIMWSLGNEIPVENKYCRHVFKHLYKYARKLDDSRIITHVSRSFWGDPLRKYSDVVCVNMYFGWYLFNERIINFVLELIRSTSPNKPWFITEFGAGAKFGFHSKSLEKFSEEKQASILSYLIECFNSKNFIQGHFIWIFRDFRSPLRQNKYQIGFNRKGIISEKNELKIIAKIYSKIKDKKSKKRRFRILPMLSKVFAYYIEQYLFDLFIMKVMDLFESRKIGKFYETLKDE